MTEAMPFLQKYDITFLRPPTIGAGWNIKEPRHARAKGKRVKCVSLCRVPGSGAAQGPCTLAVPLLGNTAPLPKGRLCGIKTARRGMAVWLKWGG